MKHLISVIVPVYKVEKYLPQCVESLLNQTYSNLEILLVDDGSPDGCGALCDRYAAQDSRITVIHKKNGGLSSARNAGLDICRGEYIAFVDSDDWLDTDGIAHLYGLSQKYQVKLVCGGRYDYREDSGEEAVGLCAETEEVIAAEEMVRRIFHWENADSAAWDKLYHRDLFKTARYPLGKISEDLPTTYKIVLEAGQVAVSDKPFYHYRRRPGSISTSQFSARDFHYVEHTLDMEDYIRENAPTLRDSVRYLKCSALGWTMTMLEIAAPDTREQFRKEYRRYLRLLQKERFFIAKSPLFSKKEKRDFLLIAYRLYRPFRWGYRCIKERSR